MNKSSLSKRLPFVFACLASVVIITMGMFYPWFDELLKKGGSLRFIGGDFFSDRLLTMAHMQTATQYGITVLDPISRQDPIFYQFGFFWLTGGISRLFGIDPLVCSNVLTLLLPASILLVVTLFAYLLIGNRWIALLVANASFLFGRLDFTPLSSVQYGPSFGKHAVVLPFAMQFIGCYADSFSLLCGYGAVAFLIAGVRKQVKWEQACWWGFLCLGSVSILFHFLQGLFFLLVSVGILFGTTTRPDFSKRSWQMGISGSLIFYVGLLICFSFQLPMGVMAFCGLAGLIALWVVSNNRKWIYAFCLTLVPAAIVVGVQYLKIKHVGGNFEGYSGSVRDADLSIPVETLVFNYLPVLFFSIISLTLKRTDQALLGMLFLATMIGVFNDKVGYNNHPYRFIPYSIPIWMTLAAIGFQALYQKWKNFENRKVFLCVMTVISFAWGGVYNLSWYSRFAAHVEPVQPFVDQVASQVEKVRRENPEAVFGLDNSMVSLAFHLAALTPAKFNVSSYLTFTQRSTALNLTEVSVPTSAAAWAYASKVGGPALSYLVSPVPFFDEAILLKNKRSTLPVEGITILSRPALVKESEWEVCEDLTNQFGRATATSFLVSAEQPGARNQYKIEKPASGPAMLQFSQVRVPDRGVLVILGGYQLNSPHSKIRMKPFLNGRVLGSSDISTSSTLIETFGINQIPRQMPRQMPGGLATLRLEVEFLEGAEPVSAGFLGIKILAKKGECLASYKPAR